MRTLPCNLKAKLIHSFGKQPAGQKDYAEQDVNAVIGLAEVQWSNHPHAILARAQRHSQNAEREINHAKNKRKNFAADKVPAKPKIKCDGARDNVNYVVCRRKGVRLTNSALQSQPHPPTRKRLPKSCKPSLPFFTRSSVKKFGTERRCASAEPGVRVSMTTGFVLVRRMYTREGGQLQRILQRGGYRLAALYLFISASNSAANDEFTARSLLCTP